MLTLEPGVVGWAPVDQVSGSPSASVASTCTIEVTFLWAVTVWVGITGALVPWSRPTTWTSCVPDDVSVNATTVAGNGLITLAVAMPSRRPRGANPGMPLVAVAPTACTFTGLPQASVFAPGKGGPAEAEVAPTAPVPRGSQR